MENQNAYQGPITLRNIVKFALPTIAMSFFMSFYTMVDGLFVSNLVETKVLSEVNLSVPTFSLCQLQNYWQSVLLILCP